MTMSTNKVDLSVIMPAYNEGRYIKANIDETLKSIRGLKLSHELVVVDDGSHDGSWEVLQEVAAQHPEVIAVRQEENLGKGQALKRGFAHVSGERVVFLDADLDVHPDQLGTLIRRM